MSAGGNDVAVRQSGLQSRLTRVANGLAAGSDPLTRRQRRWIVAILAIAAALRLAWVIYATREPTSLPINGDAFAYFFYGKQISSGGGYVNITGGEATAYYPVGYPTILAGLFWVVRHTPIPDNLAMAASILNVVFSTASVALVFAIGRRIFGAPTALVGAAILALWPNLIYYTSSTQLETTFIFLALLSILVIVTHDWSTGMPSRGRLLTFGAVLGICALVRPFSLPFLGGLGVAALVAGVGWKKAMVTVAWPMVSLVILLTPWTVRNIVALDSPVVFSTNMGDTVCMDRGPGADGGFRWATHGTCAPPHYDEVRRNTESTRSALSYTRRHPDEEVRLIWLRFKNMMSEDRDGLLAAEAGTYQPFLGARLRSLLGGLGDGYFFVASFLALLGLPAFFRGRQPNRIFVGIALLFLVLVPLGLWGNVRFHVPALPMFALAAAVPITWLWERLRPAGRPVQDPSGSEGSEPSAPVAAGVGV